MVDRPHKILPHEAPRELIPGVWEVTGSLPIPLGRNMTIVRLADGSLLLHSVIAMDEAGMRALDTLGTPSVMIIPHVRHVMDAPFCKARYPGVRVLAPAAARASFAKLAAIGDVKAVTVSHGLSLTERCDEALREAAASI